MGDMIAMIAHQWRQPITVIAMAVNNIRLDIELEEEITTESLLKMTNAITEQTQHLSKTIDDFRNFFKPNKERQYVTLCKVLGDTLGIIGKSLENNDIRLEFSQTCRREIFTFPNELLQVFLNLIGNAKDSLIRSKTADPLISIVVIEEGENEVRTTICDNGGGIPEAILDKIGQPYFTTKDEGGTGLGLYMSKTIVEKHLQGKLTWENVQTDKGAGACFIVTLPIKPKEEE
jgi:two-component system CheB/CheR fusion protein